MKREEVMRQWANWRNEMIYDKSHPTGDNPEPTPQGNHNAKLGTKAYKEMMGQIEHDLLRNEKENMSKQEVKFEKTFAEEIKSNTCPICLELMIPPKTRPMILFPCGHTFCSSCLDIVEKNGSKKCALCKKAYTQKAINVALQKLICIFTDNRQLLEKEEEKDKAAFDVDQVPDSNDPSGQISYYKTKLTLLTNRISLLNTSLQSSQVALKELDSSISSLASAEEVLNRELVDARDAYNKYKEQLALVETTLENIVDKRAKEEGKREEEKERIGVIKETLGNLQMERVKIGYLLNGLGEKNTG